MVGDVAQNVESDRYASSVSQLVVERQTFVRERTCAVVIALKLNQDSRASQGLRPKGHGGIGGCREENFEPPAPLRPIAPNGAERLPCGGQLDGIRGAARIQRHAAIIVF